MRCYEEYVDELDAAWESVERGLAGLPAPLDDLGRRWLAHIGKAHQDHPHPHRRYFRMPVAPPMIFMPLWYADGRRAAGETVSADAVIAVLRATMWGYFGIRLQDDLLDEDDPDRANTLLANACRLHMHKALREAVGNAPAFYDAFERAWLRFSALTAAEHWQVRGDTDYPEARFVEHADKVAFARIPLLAIASLSGHLGPEASDDHEPAITELIHTLGQAYGRTNDIGGWRRDLANGHRTWLLARAGWQQGQAMDEVRDRLTARLYDEGLVQEQLAEAGRLITQATQIADGMGMTGMLGFERERLADLAQARREIQMKVLRRAMQRHQRTSGT